MEDTKATPAAPKATPTMTKPAPVAPAVVHVPFTAAKGGVYRMVKGKRVLVEPAHEPPKPDNA